MSNKIYPIILSGGFGARLWPMSTKNYPKQFLKFDNKRSLFQKTIIRFKKLKNIKSENLTTITNENFRFLIRDQFEEIKVPLGNVLIEPEAKNTASSIFLGLKYLSKFDKNGIVIVCPSDHLLPNQDKFELALMNALEAANQGKIVTIGILPTRPETGFGYLELDENQFDKLKKIKRFIEKPKIELAKTFIRKKNYLWNSGIYIFKIEQMIKNFKHLNQNIFKNVSQSYTRGKHDLFFFKPDSIPWSGLKNISIDYAIMEKLKNIYTVQYQGKWNDMGSWNSVWLENKKTKQNIYKNENVTSFECQNSLLFSDDPNKHIVGFGLNNIIAIACSGKFFVADKNRVNDIKDINKVLDNEKLENLEHFSKVYRPWGWYEIILLDKGFKVKKILIKPNSSLSLQSHKYRSEHWIVVTGKPKVTIDSEIKNLTVGESTFIPCGKKHRLENLTNSGVIIIEIQLGTYLGEDDITRYEDIYSRD